MHTLYNEDEVLEKCKFNCTRDNPISVFSRVLYNTNLEIRCGYYNDITLSKNYNLLHQLFEYHL